MSKIRIGHLGTAHDHSADKMDCVLAHPDIFEVVGLAEPDYDREAAAKAYAEKVGVPYVTEEQLFAMEPDAIMVEGYELDLVPLARRCIDHGIHVHLDKPAGPDLGELQSLLDAAQVKHKIVQLAYMFRYNPAVVDCLNLVREGKLGELYEVTGVMNTLHSPEKRAWLGGLPGGIMYFLGCHMIDLAYLFLGKPDRITPFLKSTGFDGVNTIDNARAILEYPRGFSSVQVTSTEVCGGIRRQFVVCGSKGTYEIRPMEWPTLATFNGQKRPVAPDAGRHDAMMLDFAAMVRGEKENPFSYEYEMELSRILMACCNQRPSVDGNRSKI